MTNRNARKRIAEETLEILEAGYYTAPSGARIDIAAPLRAAVEGTQWWGDADWPEAGEVPAPASPRFDVQNETTFHAVKRLLDAGLGPVSCLNFASAKNPGGGFLGGSQAQEEALARASGLYPCLTKAETLYLTSRAHKNTLYLDHVIMSPDVVVFRDDADALLETPFQCDIVTSPAPNAGALRQHGDEASLERLPEVFQNRIKKVLSAMATRPARALVLGAWGCGVFGNDPALVAKWFKAALEDREFSGRFDHIAFAVLDKPEGERISAFQSVFG